MFWLWAPIDMLTRSQTWLWTGRERRYNPFWPFG